MRRLLPGSWEVHSQMGYIKSMRFGNREISGSTLEVGDEDTGPLHVVVSNRYGQVRGSVSNGQGKPAMALLLDSKKKALIQWIQVAPDGQFQAQLPPGEYKALGVAGVDPARLHNSFLKDWIMRQATDVNVDVDGQVSVSIPLVEREVIEKAYREAMDKRSPFE